MVLGRVDCESSRKCHMVCWLLGYDNMVCLTGVLCQSMFHITKYPTLKLLRNGQSAKKEYRGQVMSNGVYSSSSCLQNNVFFRGPWQHCQIMLKANLLILLKSILVEIAWANWYVHGVAGWFFFRKEYHICSSIASNYCHTFLYCIGNKEGYNRSLQGSW